MLIDWFTIGAQTLNFVILVWLLKRFLYKPILNAIDAREKRIAAELADADERKAEAQKERDEFHQKNALFDQQRSDLMSKVTNEAKVERQRLLDEARKTADALRDKRQETLRIDANRLNQAIRHRTQQEVFAVARKTLMDLAATGLEERMVEVLARRLRTMDGKQKDELSKVFGSEHGPTLVRSAFDLAAEQRATIQTALNETLSTEVRVQFETAPDLVSGIEITANGHKVAWSIADYLGSLEKGVDDLLNGTGDPESKTTPDTKDKSVPKVESKGLPEAEQPKLEAQQ